MSRKLFVSEIKIIEIVTDSQAEFSQALVLEEHYCRGHKKRKLFNNDFEYIFYERGEDSPFGNTQPFMEPTLPRTLGSEFFVSIDKTTRKPIVATLIGGEGFPIKYYKKYIEEIESLLDEVLASNESFFPSPEQYAKEASSEPLRSDILASHRKPLSNTKYLRVFVMKEFICFLSFPKQETPKQHGTRYKLLENESAQIDCGFDENDVVYLDGWIKMESMEFPHEKMKDMILVAQYVEEPAEKKKKKKNKKTRDSENYENQNMSSAFEKYEENLVHQITTHEVSVEHEIPTEREAPTKPAPRTGILQYFLKIFWRQR